MATSRSCGRALLLAALLGAAQLGAGCGLFDPRTPEAPVDESGTYVQPDQPEQVVANLQAAVAELNLQNYRRSFAPAFTFKPASSALARNQAIWTGWGRAEEERYFGIVVEAARLTAGNELRLSDPVESFLGEDRYQLQAGYVLTLNHRRTDLTTVQGQLLWVFQRGPDNLWYLQEWTDQEVGDAPSWSDLKAEFAK